MPMANSTMGSGTNIAAALEDNIHVKEMFSILQENGRDTSGLSALIDHIKGMEDFVKAAESQIGVMKSQLDTMKEVQDHPIRNVLQSTIKALETKVGQIKEQIGLLAAGVIE